MNSPRLNSMFVFHFNDEKIVGTMKSFSSGKVKGTYIVEVKTSIPSGVWATDAEKKKMRKLRKFLCKISETIEIRPGDEYDVWQAQEITK